MFGLLGYLGARSVRAEINARSRASHPANIRLSHAKLRRLCPSLYFSSGLIGSLRCFCANGLELRYLIKDMLIHGDARAAVVMQISPLLIAGYCDDLDGVCMLKFDDALATEYQLQPGDRLLTVLNSTMAANPVPSSYVAADVVCGNFRNACYINFWPLIADFLTDDREQLATCKARIAEDEYDRCQALGMKHLEQKPNLIRSGRPDRSERVAGQPWIVVRW